MSSLRKEYQDYLQMRRDLGFKYRNEDRRLKSFVSFMERRRAGYITSRLALQWAVTAGGRQPSWKLRLIAVRGFARHLIGKDPRTEVPPADLVRCRTHTKPYLYTETEIRQLMAATATLPCRGLHRASMCCLFGLLAVTGVRVSEALALQCADVDLQEGVLTVRDTKFGETRLVPLHHTTRGVLSRYAKRRDEHLPVPRSSHFLVGSNGRPMWYQTVCKDFLKLSRQIGLRALGSRCGPRIHDFRHRFAIETLLNWYRSGADVEQQLPVLSTYLGHVRVHSTYWYLSACPELMAHAARRLEKRWEVSP
jgi:integrase